MAVQIDRALGHAVPAAERVMTKDKEHAVESGLGIGCDARPGGLAGGRRRIVVAGDQVFDAIEPSEPFRHAGLALPDRKIAEVPDLVAAANGLVPARDQRLVHCRDGGKRAAVEPERTAMPEMRVAGEKDGHRG